MSENRSDWIPVVISNLPQRFDISALRVAFTAPATDGQSVVGGRAPNVVDEFRSKWGNAAPHGLFVATFMRPDVASFFLASTDESGAVTKAPRKVKCGDVELSVERFPDELHQLISSTARSSEEMGKAGGFGDRSERKPRAPRAQGEQQSSHSGGAAAQQQPKRVFPKVDEAGNELCRFCGSADHLSRRCNNKDGSNPPAAAPPSAPPVVTEEVAPRADSVSSADSGALRVQPATVTLKKREDDAPAFGASVGSKRLRLQDSDDDSDDDNGNDASPAPAAKKVTSVEEKAVPKQAVEAATVPRQYQQLAQTPAAGGRGFGGSRGGGAPGAFGGRGGRGGGGAATHQGGGGGAPPKKKGNGDECKHCGSSEHLSRRCPNK